MSILSAIRARRTALDVFLIVVGAAIFALGVDAFEAPYGLAAGGLTGLAIIFHDLAAGAGVNLPIGLQVIVMNIALIVLVVRQYGIPRTWRTILGIVASSLFLDLLEPFVPPMEQSDLLLCAVWGGIVTGAGLGVCFRGGGNTGGTDIIAQFLSDRTAVSIGTISLIEDVIVIGLSAPVFGIRTALYAVIAMYVSARLLDLVFEGPRTERAAWIISEEYAAIAHEIMYAMDRGCTEITARGSWSGHDRPTLFVVLNRREIAELKAMVAEIDENAIVIITDVHEAFGEGFHAIAEEGR